MNYTAMKKNRIVLSGIRPTGKLHIGNYLGALQHFVALQNEYSCYFFIADLHSLNENHDPKKKREQTLNLAADYLAAGIDPKKCTFFLQSKVPEHSEFAILLSNIVPVSYLFRMTQFKEKSSEKEKKNVNAGLLYYPILMASDILLYKTTDVPVGHDQKQHVEFARDIARFFNNAYGKALTEPEAIFTQSPKIMSLTSPDKKMSASEGEANVINIDDEPAIIRKKIARAVTDTGDGKSTGAKNLLELLRIYGQEKEYEKFRSQMQDGDIRYSELKALLSDEIIKYFSKFREKKRDLMKNPKIVEQALLSGSEKARKTAKETLFSIKAKIGLL